MRGLTTSERETLLLVADDGQCDPGCADSDLWSSSHEPDFVSLVIRGLLANVRCHYGVAWHLAVTSLGRLALRIDAAVRGEVFA